MQDHDDFAFEPIPGLPEKLPTGEALLWQGSPDWRSLAVAAFHIRKVAVYFAILTIWQVASALRDGATSATTTMVVVSNVAIAAAAIGILCLLAYFYARGTIYTLTSKRIVIRSGLALPVTLNLPLSLIEAASVKREPGETGSIALRVIKPNRVAWLVLWPNARPWNMANPQPMLRCLKNVDAIAPMVTKALEADSGVSGKRSARGPVSAMPTDHAPSPAGATFAA